MYIPQYPETERVRDQIDQQERGVLVPIPDNVPGGEDNPATKKAFSLAHFIPLLSDRIYVLSPFTRSYLVSWISVLDSVPELELISYLPEFFDGLLLVTFSQFICSSFFSQHFQEISFRSDRGCSSRDRNASRRISS